MSVGAILWVCFCIGIVLVRGPRWDETYEHAQVITRHVPYPEGHPLFQYCRSAFSGQTFLSAGMLAAGLGPGIICGFRNALLLLSTVLPVFLFGATLSGRALWGHAAALLALSGVLIDFDGSYPFVVWPGLFSNGPVGGLFALCTLYCLLRDHWRTAFLLVGLMPCIHIGQAPPVWGMAMLCAAWGIWRGKRSEVARGAAFALGGLAVSAALFLFLRWLHVPEPTGGPFFSAADSQAIWRNYTAIDPHRRFPAANGQIAMAGFLVLTSLACLDTWRKTRAIADGPVLVYFGLLLYGAGIAATVWGVMFVHHIMGQQIPFLLIGWMPYRLLNHIPPLLLAVSVGVLGSSAPNGGRRTGHAQLALFGAIAFVVVRPLSISIVGEELYQRYWVMGDAVVFGLFGAALGVLVSRLAAQGSSIRRLGGLTLVMLAGLAWHHQFGTACVLAGLAAALVLVRWPRGASGHSLRLIRGLALVLIFAQIGMVCAHQWGTRNPLPRSTFDRGVTSYLKERAEDSAMLVAQPDEFLLQARTGHPVLVDSATSSLISYVPALGPGIDKVFSDVYGISFRPASDRPPAKPWREIWAERTQAEWQRLSQEYGFRYLICYSDLSPDLPFVFRVDNATLFEIPEARK